MTGEVRIKSPTKQLLVLFLVFFPQLLLLVLSIFVDVPEGAGLDANNRSAITQAKLQQASMTLGFFMLPAFLYAIFCFRSNYGSYLGLKKAQHANMYLLAVLCIIFAFHVVFWLGWLNEKINLPEWMTRMESMSSEQMETILKVNGPGDLILNLVVVALLPAFCEELFFRGAMQRVLIHVTRNPWTGIIITAILFSALHLQFQGFLPRLFMGMVMGILYWYSGSLWTCITAHFVYNAIQVVAVAYAPTLTENNEQVPILAGVASGIAVWAILWFYRKQSVTTWARVYREEEPTSIS